MPAAIARRRSPAGTVDLSTSFLDLCSCALGGLILIMILLVPTPAAPGDGEDPPLERPLSLVFNLPWHDAQNSPKESESAVVLGAVADSAELMVRFAYGGNEGPILGPTPVSLRPGLGLTIENGPFGPVRLSCELGGRHWSGDLNMRVEVDVTLAGGASGEDHWPLRVDAQLAIRTPERSFPTAFEPFLALAQSQHEAMAEAGSATPPASWASEVCPSGTLVLQADDVVETRSLTCVPAYWQVSPNGSARVVNLVLFTPYLPWLPGVAPPTGLCSAAFDFAKREFGPPAAAHFDGLCRIGTIGTSSVFPRFTVPSASPDIMRDSVPGETAGTQLYWQPISRGVPRRITLAWRWVGTVEPADDEGNAELKVEWAVKPE